MSIIAIWLSTKSWSLENGNGTEFRASSRSLFNFWSVFKMPKSNGAIIGSLAISFNWYEYLIEKPVGNVNDIAN